MDGIDPLDAVNEIDLPKRSHRETAIPRNSKLGTRNLSAYRRTSTADAWFSDIALRGTVRRFL